MARKKPVKKRVASWAVTDDFWARVEPLVPVRERPADKEYTRKAGGGRKPKPARLVFEAVVGGCVCVANRLPVEGFAEGTVRQRQRDPQAVFGMGACRRVRSDLGDGVGGIRPDGRDRLAMAEYRWGHV